MSATRTILYPATLWGSSLCWTILPAQYRTPALYDPHYIGRTTVVVSECNPTRPPGRPTLYHSLPWSRITLYYLAWYMSALLVRIHSYSFLCRALFELRETRDRESATIKKKMVISGRRTLCAETNWGKNVGGKRRTTPVTTACLSISWKARSMP